MDEIQKMFFVKVFRTKGQLFMAVRTSINWSFTLKTIGPGFRQWVNYYVNPRPPFQASMEDRP